MIERRGGTIAMHVWRWVSLALAVGLPVLIVQGARKQERTMRALLERGVVTQGVVTEHFYSAKKHWARFRYRDATREFEHTVDADRAPAIDGSPIAITYLPENPDKHWAGSPVTEQVVAEAGKLDYMVTIWPAILFGSSFIATEVQLRRRRANQPPAKLGVRGATYLLTIAFYVVFVGVLLYDDVRVVREKAFGPRPLGLPNLLFTFLLLTILYAPAVFVIPHIVLLVMRANPHGEPMGRWQTSENMRELIHVDPELRRSNRIAIAGVLYFVALAIAWIVYAAYRGI